MPDRFDQDTVRLDILRYVLGLYEAASDNPAPPVGQTYYGIKFSVVQLGPLGDADLRKQSAVGIIPGPERKTYTYPYRECSLDIDIEFRFNVNKSDADPYVMAETMLGVVQQVMYDDETLGGKAIKIDEVSSEINAETYADTLIEGVVRFTILYRHSQNDVYDPFRTE